MTRIRATCPDCGEVDLSSCDVVLRVEDNVSGSATTYRFECPDCDGTIVKPADQRVTRLLAAGGVALQYPGAEMFDLALARLVRGECPRPTPITADDLLDFHELLTASDFVTDLLDHLDH